MQAEQLRERPTVSQHVLIGDGDKDIVRLVRSYLEHAGFDVITAYDGNTALYALTRELPDVAILDLMLPDIDGLDITRYIRKHPSLARTYIIMLTNQFDVAEKVLALESGADDSVIKPFNPHELVARVRAGIRRRRLDHDPAISPVYRYGDLELDVAKRHVCINGTSISLTPTEFNLLSVLMEYPGVPFTRMELVRKRLGYDYETLDRTLDSHVRNLRKKIEPDSANPTYVQTVYGVGYRLGEP